MHSDDAIRLAFKASKSCKNPVLVSYDTERSTHSLQYKVKAVPLPNTWAENEKAFYAFLDSDYIFYQGRALLKCRTDQQTVESIIGGGVRLSTVSHRGLLFPREGQVVPNP